MLEDLKPYKPYRPCRIRTILFEELDEADRDILVAALADMENYPHNYLARVMRSKGIMLSDKSVVTHRNGDCSC